MTKSYKKRALAPIYVSPNQLVLEGFETPFERKLNKNNRWVVLAHLIPWDEICNIYLKQVGVSDTGRPPLNPRIVLGSLIIKHMCNFSDEETVEHISENVYMQYFIGYTSFSDKLPFDSSLFVEFRKRLGLEKMNLINEKIVEIKTRLEKTKDEDKSSNDSEPDPPKKGRVIFDATACPQDIAYPTDLDLLSEARKKSEQIIDILYKPLLHDKKPRTYREIARKEYLQTAQKKNKTRKEIRRAVKAQLGYLKRNIDSIHQLLDKYESIPLNRRYYKYFLVIQTLFQQQKYMYDSNTHKVEDRIVSIHQPHIRPIVRGKAQAKTEFGSKIHVSIIDGISFLDELSWNTFNEGSHMMDYVEKFRKRFGCYPREVLADQIYCTRENRAKLKDLGIKLIAKPLGRPTAVQIHVSPGERNPIEGKFGQAKTGYGLNRIKARLKQTSESWIASIFLVLNLVKLAGVVLHCLLFLYWKGFSVKNVFYSITQINDNICNQFYFTRQLSISGKVMMKIDA